LKRLAADLLVGLEVCGVYDLWLYVGGGGKMHDQQCGDFSRFSHPKTRKKKGRIIPMSDKYVTFDKGKVVYSTSTFTS